MNEAAEKLNIALTIYMAQAELESNQTFQELSVLLKRIASDPHPNPKAFAEICLKIFSESKKQLDAAKDKAPHEKFEVSRRVILNGYVPDEYFRMRMLNIFRSSEKKTVKPEAKLFYTGLENLLWTEATIEKEYQDIKATLVRVAGTKRLSEVLEEKFAEYKQTASENFGAVKSSKEPKAAVESGAVRKTTKSRPSRVIELNSKGFETAPEKAVVPKKPKAAKQPAVYIAPTTESAKRPPPPSLPPNFVLSQTVAFKEIESTETYKVSKETEETKKTRQKATMSRESVTVDVTENPNKEKFRLAILTACRKFIAETNNKSYQERFAKIAERVTKSPISESAGKLYEDIKREAGEITYFVEMLERNYEEFRQAPGEMYREKAQKEAEQEAKKDAEWKVLQERVDAKRKKYEEKTKGNKREPTVEEIKIREEVQEQRENLELLRDAIVKEKAKPESEREESALKVLEAKLAEGDKNLIKLEKQLLVASGVLHDTTPKTMEILEKRKETETLDATLKGSLEKLKSGLEQWQEDRARQKASVPQQGEEVEKALSEMRRNLEKTKKPEPAELQAAKDKLKKWDAGKQELSDHDEMEMGENPKDAAPPVETQQKDDAGYLVKSSESFEHLKVVDEVLQSSLRKLKVGFVDSVNAELQAKRAALCQVAQVDLSEVKILEVNYAHSHSVEERDQGAERLAKKWWDVFSPNVISDFISTTIARIPPYEERVNGIKQQCTYARYAAELVELRTDKKEHDIAYVAERLKAGKFSDTAKNEKLAPFYEQLDKYRQLQAGVAEVKTTWQEKVAAVESAEKLHVPERKKRPLGSISLKIPVPKHAKKNDSQSVELREVGKPKSDDSSGGFPPPHK